MRGSRGRRASEYLFPAEFSQLRDKRPASIDSCETIGMQADFEGLLECLTHLVDLDTDAAEHAICKNPWEPLCHPEGIMLLDGECQPRDPPLQSGIEGAALVFHNSQQGSCDARAVVSRAVLKLNR